MSREARLFQALTTTDELGDLLPVLHQHAVSAVEGRSSVLFRVGPSGALRPASALGTGRLPAGPWPGRFDALSLASAGDPAFLDSLDPPAADLLGTPSAVLVPLRQVQEPVGVLVVGCDATPTADQLNHVALVGHAFVLALARARATTEAEFQSRLAELLHDFSHDVSAAELNASLEALCNGTNRLFAAARTSVWLHNRRTRMLVLTASSDAGYLSEDRRIPTSELAAPAVNAFRRDRAEIASARTAEPGAPTVTLLVPLKGRRRALGTLVLEAVPLEPATQEELVDRADLLGRQLSGAVENVLLFEGVLRSRRELEQTFDSLADLVAVTDPEGRLVYANRPFVERSGRTRDALIEQPLAEVVGEPTQLLVSRATNGHVERETMSAEVEDPVLRGVFQVTLTPMPGAEPESLGVVFVARDLTSQARLEAERTELRNRLLQSEKLVALGELVAGIAHELNNPLQGVLGHIELLRATGAFPKAIRRDMQRIYREADRAAKIVRNLLVFAGSRRLVRRRTNLNATLSRVLSLRALALRAGRIDVVRHHDDELPRVKGDPLLLQQVLLNIVLNAEQAMGSSGGRLETETSVKLHDGRPHVTVQIRDTGPGLPPAVLPRVFEPFFTTKEVGKGTGLGLAIAYGIMQEHGGQIVASNHQDGGAVFTVRLPAETG